MYINESARRTRRKGIQGPKNTYRGMANIRKTPGESEWAPALEQVNINRSGNAAEVTFPDLDSQKQHTGENRPLAAENWEASAVAERCEGHDGLPTGFSAELSKMEMETRNLEASIKQHTAVIAMHMATHDTASQAIRAREGARTVAHLYKKKNYTKGMAISDLQFLPLLPLKLALDLPPFIPLRFVMRTIRTVQVLVLVLNTLLRGSS